MAETSIYGAETQSDRLFLDDPEAAEAAREIKAWLAASEPSKALITCERMLSLHPGDRLFEGLRLEVERKDREVRLEFIRALTVELEKVPDFDARIESIREALHRYPSETYLAELLDNAIARRDLFNAVIAEARSEEHADGYDRALKQWYLLRELFPSMPGLENEIRRVETLAETQKKMKRRTEFVDLIFQLSSTGQYNRALYQCINALSEYPNDGGLLTLKKTLEEKAERGTELQRFIADGLTFLHAHEIDAALECFGKAKAFDQSNLQVRYLIGIALLEKARLLIQDDRRKLSLLVDEAKSFIPNQPELQTVSFEPAEMPDEPHETSLVRIQPPAEVLEHAEAEPAPAVEAAPVTEPEEPAVGAAVSEAPPSLPEIFTDLHAAPAPAPSNGIFQKVVVVGVVIVITLIIGSIVYAKRPNTANPAGAPQRVDIQATPEGAEIFIDDQMVGVSKAQAQLGRGNHTVTVRMAGYESRSLGLSVDSQPKSLQVDLQPIPMELRVFSDQPGSVMWVDEKPQGEITDAGLTISGLAPGVRSIAIQTPRAEIEFDIEFVPGKKPVVRGLPPRQVANVLFAGSADLRSHVECNCAPAGLRVGETAEILREGGLEMPVEGQQPAELWMGKRKKSLTIHGSRTPAATIAVFSNLNSVAAVRSSSVGQDR